MSLLATGAIFSMFYGPAPGHSESIITRHIYGNRSNGPAAGVSGPLAVGTMILFTVFVLTGSRAIATCEPREEYRDGQGIAQNDMLAVKWFCKTAEQLCRPELIPRRLSTEKDKATIALGA